MNYFLTVGTQPHQFKRLIDYATNNITDNLVMQIGNTNYSGAIKNFTFSDNFDEYLNSSEVIITHGGVGSIIGALLKEKKVIAVPRDVKYEEHVDNHQYEIVSKLAKEKYILMATSEEEFKHCLQEIEVFGFKKYNSNKQHFNKKIIEDLNV